MKKLRVFLLIAFCAVLFFPRITFAVGRVSASAISGNTTESGGAATFTIRLDEPIFSEDPEENHVTIPLSSSNPSEGTVSPSEITFQADEWFSTKTVTVTGVDDHSIDGDQSFTIVLGTVTSGSEYYNNYNPADVTVTNEDDDEGVVDITTTSHTSREQGTGGTIELILTSEPTADVTVDAASSDTNEGIIDVSTITFTPENWSTPQSINIYGVDDYVDDGDKEYTIEFTHTISEDSNYNDIPLVPITIENLDDDVVGISRNGSGSAVVEGGATATVSIILETQPTEDVEIVVQSNDQLSYDDPVLLFTPENWDTRQFVTISATDDGAIEQPEHILVQLIASSQDNLYDGYTIRPVLLNVMSNDADRWPVLTTNGNIIDVKVDGELVDQKRIGTAKPLLSRLKTAHFYTNANYKTVAYLAVYKHRARLILFRFTPEIKLTHRIERSFPITDPHAVQLEFSKKHHRIRATVGNGSDQIQRTWKLTKRGRLWKMAE